MSVRDFNIAVLTSGNSRGSNFSALVDYIKTNKSPVKISFVIITKKSAPVKEKCLAYGIPSIFLPTKDFDSFESSLQVLCRDFNLSLLCLAGFLKKFSQNFISNVGIPIVNIHPSLLPDYGGKGMYGKSVHEKVFQSGDKFSGATVHLVNMNYDEGKILAQQKCDISDCSSPEEIADRVLQVEHQLYAPSIEKFLLSSTK